MSSPTAEQKEAIEKRGKNIIVSAGAGSGKTFVLKERVLREVTEDTSVDKLIILTFTKNAAAEMKERIRKIINSHPEVADQASLVDSAYITTFDSFSQSLVKKYNYLLNISKDFGIIDSNIVNTELNNILDSIFDGYYKNPTPLFEEMINYNCYKNDRDLKKAIISIYHDLTNIIGREKYLDSYVDNYYSKEHVDKLIDELTDLAFNSRDQLIPLYEELIENTLSEKALGVNQTKMNEVSYATNLDELKDAISIPLAKAAKGVYDEEYKPIKEKISKLEKNILDLLEYPKEEYIKKYLSTKNSNTMMIEIIKELDKRIMKFKDDHNSYEFSDIAFKAIELVEKNEDVREEIKNNTYEIMIDEYQDTNDIQEVFISYIQNNNVYMVGDVKQSIYRFRNANPYIFKDKYDRYKDGIEGYKIDLTKNFRSRGEVINNINDLFSIIMTDNVGGANYNKEHCMGHGNLSYDEMCMDNYDYNMELLNYKLDKDKIDATQAEVESFIMAKDIKKHINANELVVHEVNGKNVLEPISYRDFCILVDKSKNFETIKKIFEYEGIPTTIYKDVSIKEDDEVYILKNLITLIIKIKDNIIRKDTKLYVNNTGKVTDDNSNVVTYKKPIFDTDFKHAFMSIARSYIFKMSDNDIFKVFNDNSFEETELYRKIEEVANITDGLSNKEILTILIDRFDIVNKLVLVGDIKERSTKLEYFVKQASSLNDFGYDIYSLNSYFDEIINGDNDITMGGKNASGNAVKIMTIHGSKGLEFSYVYCPFLNSSFKGRKRSRQLLSQKYGFIVPFNDEGAIGDLFTIKLHDYHELCETISEKIRLFYVAITRAKEKFIMVNQYDEKVEPLSNPSENDILETTSYTGMISLLKFFFDKYKVDINLEELGINKEYNKVKDYNYKDVIIPSSEVINIKPLNIDYKLLDNKHFSKALTKVMDKELKSRLDFGTYMHYVFEVYNFNNNNLDDLDITDLAREKIFNFLKHEEVKDISSAKIYKEHEIKFQKDGSIFHGFIDLLVEYPDHFDIIDYKLSNIDSEEYVVQLSGYKEYIEGKYKKDTNIYLYSINKDILKKLN